MKTYSAILFGFICGLCLSTGVLVVNANLEEETPKEPVEIRECLIYKPALKTPTKIYQANGRMYFVNYKYKK